jgi:AcrR family transcriptional regulator
MRNIADEAGVALSQVTYYYKNKEQLLLEVINMMILQYLGEVEEKLESAADAKQKLSSLIGFFKELVRDNPQLFRLFIDFTAQALWIPSFREQLDELFHRLTELIEVNLGIDTKTDSRYLGYSTQSVVKLILGALLGTSIQIILGSDRDGSIESLYLAESLLN